MRKSSDRFSIRTFLRRARTDDESLHASTAEQLLACFCARASWAENERRLDNEERPPFPEEGP